MANLKTGTLIGGNLIWHSANLPLKSVDDALYIKTSSGDKQIYSEHHKPTPAEVGAVNKAGDTMSGNLIIRTENHAELRIDAGTNKRAQLYMSEDNTQMGHYIRYAGDDDNATYFGTRQSGVDKDYMKVPRFGGVRFTVSPVSEAPQGTEADSLTRRDYVDTKLALSGGTMTGALVVNSDITFDHRLKSLGLTTSSQQVMYTSGTSIWYGAPDVQKITLEGASDAKFYVQNAVGQENEIYHEGHKPTPNEIGAYTKTEINDRAKITNEDNIVKYGETSLQFGQQYGVGGDGTNGKALKNPTNDWWHHIVLNHANSSGYYTDIATCFHSDSIKFRRVTQGVQGEWKELYHEGHKPTPAEVGALPASGKAVDSDKLDGLDSSSFLRSDTDDSFSGALVSTARDKGIFGTYDSNKTDQIWSMGTAYKNSSTGDNFGNLYGLAYKHTNNATGGTMAGGHQMVWCVNGSPKSSIGESGFWTDGYIDAGGKVYTTVDEEFGFLHQRNGHHTMIGCSSTVGDYLVGGKPTSASVWTDYIRIGRNKLRYCTNANHTGTRIYHEGDKPSTTEIDAVSINPTPIGDGTDLYEYFKTCKSGFYKCGSSVLSKPTGLSYGDFLVIDHGGNYRSIICVDQNNNHHTLYWNDTTHTGWSTSYSTSYKPSSSDVNAVNKAGDTMSGALTFTGHNGIKMKNGKKVLWSHDNGSVTLSASGENGILYLGYSSGTDYQTSKVVLHRNMYSSNGTTIISDTSGQLYDVGTRVYSEHHKPTPAEVGALPLNQVSVGVASYDKRSNNYKPNEVNTTPSVNFSFKANSTDGFTNGGGTYHGIMSFRPYGSGSDWSGGGVHQIAFGQNGNLSVRYGTNETWNAWRMIYNEGNKPNSLWETGTGGAGVHAGPSNEVNFTSSTSALHFNYRQVSGTKINQFVFNAGGNDAAARLDFGNAYRNGVTVRKTAATGYQVGSYNTQGDNSSKTNPIYTIGTNYMPSDTSLGNMYGIGYCHANAAFIPSALKSGNWGMYVAANGSARIFLDGGSGQIRSTSEHYVNGNRVYHTGYKPSAADVGAMPRNDAYTKSESESHYGRDFIWSSSSTNNMRRSGYYRLNPGVANAPGGAYSTLLHVRGASSDTNFQLTAPYSDQKLYFRSFNDTSSTRGWSRVYTTSDKPSKADVGLSNVNNWGATSSVSDSSNTKYATAGAAKQAYDRGTAGINAANAAQTKANQAYDRGTAGINAANAAQTKANQAYDLATSNKVYTGTASNYTNFPIGHTLTAWIHAKWQGNYMNNTTGVYLNSAPNSYGVYTTDWYGQYKGTRLVGTWAYRGYISAMSNVNTGLFQRIA